MIWIKSFVLKKWMDNGEHLHGFLVYPIENENLFIYYIILSGSTTYNFSDHLRGIICGVVFDRSSLRRINEKTVYGVRYKA